jgi:hypothetical protein
MRLSPSHCDCLREVGAVENESAVTDRSSIVLVSTLLDKNFT